MDIYNTNNSNDINSSDFKSTQAKEAADIMMNNDRIDLAKHILDKMSEMGPGSSHVAIERLSSISERLLFHDDNKELKMKALELLEKNVPEDSCEFKDILEMILNS